MDNLKKRPVFIDLRTDFGFKRCFGDEKVMKRFLNIIIGKEYGEIESLVFENVESTRVRESQRGVTFDLRCRLANGDEVIVEMQNYGHRFFQTRANYYLYNLMDKHIGKGTAWSERETDIPHLIGVFILGAPMDELTEVITQTAECDLSTKEIIWDRIRKYYISLPNFSFDISKLSDEDIWIQTIKNIGKMERIDPKIYDRADDELKALIDKARISALS
ncbi:MAG: Rpn family recombination-promoting nuclease/putative transposase, partial [Paludibacteraceae bacterium]|nr:Rpn family recombination-promoting nuclease/putative transposase [Paludibacteraceae bacterium]